MTVTSTTTSPTSLRFHANTRTQGWLCSAPDGDGAIAFHRSLPGYAPTPLVDLPEIAAELGVRAVVAKDESTRLGLPAFKALGASWALHRAMDETGARPGQTTVVTATDGNHGRAVARSARLLDLPARIFIPAGGVHPTAVAAIAAEGAEVVEVTGSYDNAVATAARFAEETGALLIQDTAWEGYEEIPGWIVEGYATLFAEVDHQLADRGLGRPALVLVPTGVGSLLQAALLHYRSSTSRLSISVASVEPTAASCMAPSLTAGHPVTVDTGRTVMSGLNCGTPSSLAWPYIEAGLDAAVTVDDDATIAAGHDLARLGVQAGPCGAAALAGARAALLGPDAAAQREHLGITADSVVVLTVTEGSAANPLPPQQP